MTQQVGIIGVGHFAGYLIEGFARAGNCAALRLFSRTKARAERLAAIHPEARVFELCAAGGRWRIGDHRGHPAR
ncbi:MAG: hypothetical protein V9G14_14695 [Cypionkella sp.]